MKKTRSTTKGLIVIEGIDGSGKTTLTSELKSRLVSEGYSCDDSREPQGGSIGQLIRRYLSKEEGSIDAVALELLFAADRLNHIWGNHSTAIIESLAHNHYHITDRYIYSSFAYREREVVPIYSDALLSLIPLPEKLIYIDIPLDVALDRIKQGLAYRGRDIYENGVTLHWVLKRYPDVIKKFPQVDVITLDGTKPRSVLVDEARDFILLE